MGAKTRFDAKCFETVSVTLALTTVVMPHSGNDVNTGAVKNAAVNPPKSGIKWRGKINDAKHGEHFIAAMNIVDSENQKDTRLLPHDDAKLISVTRIQMLSVARHQWIYITGTEFNNKL